MCWNFSAGDSVYSFPKPFQLGLVYGITVEKALDYMYHKDPTTIRKWFRAVFDSSVFRQEMVSPTALKPIVECMTNYSWMRKSPLENQSQQRLSPEFRFTPTTSETAKVVGSVTGLSPIMIDNMIRGHFGTLGRYGTAGIDWIMMKMQFANIPAPPAFLPDQKFGLRAFMKNPYEPSEYVNRFHKAMDRATKRKNDFNAFGMRLDSQGKWNFWQKNANQLAFYGEGHGSNMQALHAAQKHLSEINATSVNIRMSRDIDPETKRDRLLFLRRKADDLAKDVFMRHFSPEDQKAVY